MSANEESNTTPVAQDPEVSETTTSKAPATPATVEDGRRLYIGNLPQNVTPDDIKLFFKDYAM